MRRTNTTLITASLLILPTLALGFAAAQTTKAAKTNAEIRQEIIKQSIASYKGSCPCPYSVDRAGRMCGRRSAYSKPGRASPICCTAYPPQKYWTFSREVQFHSQ